MTMRPDRNASEELAGRLEAIASEARLALLQKLQRPQTVSEIQLTKIQGVPGEGARSRQAVRKHLDRLLAVGVIQEREAERPWGISTEYFVNHQTLFALAEEIRDLALRRAVVEPQTPTATMGDAPHPTRSGPRLVIVRGLNEGSDFPLDGAGPWMVGRRREAEISLDYDPFVSGENTLITREGSGFIVRPVPSSRNGTSVNFATLATGKQHPLEHGDILRVGRSHLVFWT